MCDIRQGAHKWSLQSKPAHLRCGVCRRAQQVRWRCAPFLVPLACAAASDALHSSRVTGLLGATVGASIAFVRRQPLGLLAGSFGVNAAVFGGTVFGASRQCTGLLATPVALPRVRHRVCVARTHVHPTPCPQACALRCCVGMSCACSCPHPGTSTGRAPRLPRPQACPAGSTRPSSLGRGEAWEARRCGHAWGMRGRRASTRLLVGGRSARTRSGARASGSPR